MPRRPWSRERVDKARKLYNSGLTMTAVAKRMGTTVSTVSRNLSAKAEAKLRAAEAKRAERCKNFQLSRP